MRVILCKRLSFNWIRQVGTGFARPVRRPTQVTHLAGGWDYYL
jgi:hypothetical protein